MEYFIQYLAIVFSCVNNVCGVITIEEPFTSKTECQKQVDVAVKELTKSDLFNIVDGRCVNFHSGLKS